MPKETERLVAALETLRERASSPDVEGVSEAATRSLFVEPLLEGMGFQGLTDIVWEYHVKASNQHIDFVLKINGSPTVAVEVKSFATELADKHAAQVVQYAAVEGIKWCLLTNGRELRVYNAELGGDLAAKQLADIDLLSDDRGDAVDVLAIMSKDGLTDPQASQDWMKRTVLDRRLRLLFLDSGSNVVRQIASSITESTDFDMAPEEVARWFARVLAPAATPTPPQAKPTPTATSTQISYWLLPAGPGPDGETPVEILHWWLDAGMWGMGRSTPNRRWMEEKDFVCFYASGVGIVAWARLASLPDELVTAEEWPEPTPMEGEVFKVPLEDVRWLEQPLAIDDDMRRKLDAFADKKPETAWSWLVQSTRRLSEHDCLLLTGRS